MCLADVTLRTIRKMRRARFASAGPKHQQQQQNPGLRASVTASRRALRDLRIDAGAGFGRGG